MGQWEREKDFMNKSRVLIAAREREKKKEREREGLYRG